MAYGTGNLHINKACKLKRVKFFTADSEINISFRKGFRSLISKVSFFLQSVSDSPLAKISK